MTGFHIWEIAAPEFPTMKSLDPKPAKKEEAPAAGKCCPEEGITCCLPKEEKIDFSNVKIEPLFEESVDFETFAKSDFRAVKIEACEAVPKSKNVYAGHLIHTARSNCTSISVVLYHPNG